MQSMKKQYTPGQQVIYYPRQGKPGHLVTIIEVHPHFFHRAFIRFRYCDGKEREVSIGRFFTEAD